MPKRPSANMIARTETLGGACRVCVLQTGHIEMRIVSGHQMILAEFLERLSHITFDRVGGHIAVSLNML